MTQQTFVIKARGLPWSATPEEVSQFFSDVNIINGENGVHFTFNKEGRPSGECFIEVEGEDEKERALAHNNEHMGKRYIEIKEAKHSEMEWVVNRMQSEKQPMGENVVRLRGLPYGCSKQDIDAFFSGLQIVPYGITITLDQDGRASGDAYVEFATHDDAEAAMGKHKEKIGHRYIEIFRSSRNDIKHVVGPNKGDSHFNKGFGNQRPGPYDRPNFGSGRRGGGRGGSAMGLGPSGFNSQNHSSSFGSGRSGRGGPMRGGRMGGGFGGGSGMNNRPNAQQSKTGYTIHMRGLPFEATTKDVMQFFSPLNPVDIRFNHDTVTGRVNGECDVDFSTHNDAEAGMQKDKQSMGHRYIELFLRSSGGGGGGWSSGGGGGGGGGMNRDGPPLMNSNNSYGGGYGNQGGGGGSGSGGGGYGSQSSGGYGTQTSGGYNSGGYNSSQGGGYDGYKGVSYSNIGGGGGNYYGNMR